MVHSKAYEFMSKLWIRHRIQQLRCKYCPVIFIADGNRVMLINFPDLYISLAGVTPLDDE